MKIVFLITRLDYSGGPKMLAWVANQFAKAGHDVFFIAVYSDQIGQPLESNISFISLNIRQSKFRFIRNTFENIRIQWKLRNILKQINPDLVVGFLYPVDLFFTLFNSIKKKYKVILSQRFDPYIEHGLTAFVKKIAVQKANGVVFQTVGAKNYYNISKIEKHTIIYNPVTSRTLKYIKEVEKFEKRKNIIVLPGRLDVHQKRQDVMVKAYEIIHKKHPDVQLVLLGNGPDKKLLENLIQEKNLDSFIQIHPAIPTAEEYTKDCKIVCMTSDYEGMPNTLIEAMAIGINIVATDCRPGGAKALVNDGYNGFIVPCGDYQALAKKISYLLDHPNISDTLANESKKIASQLAEEKIACQWIEFAKNVFDK